MIHQLDFNGIDKVEKAIQRLQLYEPPEATTCASAVAKTA